MISRFYLKKLFSFQEVELFFEKGLVVISGPSGAGKSILINTILSTFGYSDVQAILSEITFLKPDIINHISKKHLFALLSPFIQYLSVRDKFNFNHKDIILILDNSLSEKNQEYKKILEEYKKDYSYYLLKHKELQNILGNEEKINELCDFNRFEIKKIDSLKRELPNC